MSNSSTLISSKGKENNDTKDIEIIDIDKANNGNNDKVDDIWLSKKTPIKKNSLKISNNSKSLWKLVRMKYIPRLEFRLCRTCSNILFHSTSRIVEAEDGGVKITFNLCKNCVELNIEVKDILCDWTIKKTQKEINNQ